MGIVNDDNYHAFLKVIAVLMETDPLVTTPTGQTLLFLATEVEEYEKVKFPFELSCECMDKTYKGIKEDGEYKGYHLVVCDDCGMEWYSETRG